MVKKKDEPVVNINNYGINNGVIADKVIISEDSDIPLSQNYTVNRVPDSIGIRAGYMVNGQTMYEIKPKKGVWYSPFVAYFESEYSLVQGSMVSRYSSGSGQEGVTNNLILDSKPTRCYFINRTYGAPITPDNGIFFICSKKPSFLFFGEWQSSKVYVISIE